MYKPSVHRGALSKLCLNQLPKMRQISHNSSSRGGIRTRKPLTRRGILSSSLDRITDNESHVLARMR